MASLNRFLAIVVVSLVTLAHLKYPTTSAMNAKSLLEEMVRYKESESLNNGSSIVPESQVYLVYFEPETIAALTQSNNTSSTTNSTKQSQDFVTHESTTAAPIVGSTPVLPVLSLSTSTLSPALVTALSEGEVPVASRVTREGNSIQCGEANPHGDSDQRLVPNRIVGGSKTEPGEFPFQVRLNIKSRRGSGICGGVILDDRHILTAAHCMTACMSTMATTVTIETDGVQATLGDHSIRASDGELDIDIESIRPHEKYDACNYYSNDNDIAILETKSPIKYKFTSDGYGSINRPCMPKSGTIYREGEPVIVSGWGVAREGSNTLSNILRFVQVPVVGISKCQDTYGSRVTSDHVCAGYQAGGKDSCQGDSGGPLVRIMDNRYELVGIVSFGYGCGQPGAPGVYTKVASYIDWIQSSL
ncbi:Mite allergen Der p 3 [Fragariocoptes setiger]|uniref:Mite allergen Der p 3 n=1 Tax=Fragariocoptes setiger TaxID=1670756 RepID=A0ABQ7SC90_9ACAR|nr:Mite allergen Der p 3 [Fragariocoptes setiger]